MKIICIATYEKINKPINYFSTKYENAVNLIRTFGYTVEEGEQAPVVEAKQGWLLLLPKGSPVISRMKGDNMETTT